MSLTAIATYSRYTKKISKDGTIATTESSYCQNRGIISLRECLIRSDSQQDLQGALNTIDDRTKEINFSNRELEKKFKRII